MKVFKRKLFLMIVALGGCFALVVAIVAVTTFLIGADRADLLRIAIVQSDLRSLDDALDHARTEVDGLLLTGDTVHRVRRDAYIANAEAIFTRLASPAEADRAEVSALTDLRARMTALERAIERPDATAAVPLTASGRQNRDARDSLAMLAFAALGTIDVEQHQRLLHSAALQLIVNRVLWLSVLALAVIGGLIALVSYRSMRLDLAGRARKDQALRESEAKFSGILAIAADAIVTADDGGRIVDFNQSAETMFGYRAADVIGKPLRMLLPEPVGDADSTPTAATPSIPAIFEGGGPTIEFNGRRPTGEQLSVEAAISRLQTRNGLLLTAVLRDVTEHRRRERREHVLAKAATRLSPRLLYDDQLTEIASLAVGDVGDWCVLDVIEEGSDGQTFLHRVTSSPDDERLDAALWECEADAPDWAARDPVIDVFRTGNSLFVPAVTPEWLDAHYGNPQTRAILRNLGVESLMTVPLTADGRVIGVLTVGTCAPRRATSEDLELTQVLADRAAQAVEAARAYRKAQRSTAARDAVLAIVSHDLTGGLGTIAMYANQLRGTNCDDPAERDRLCDDILEGTTLMRHMMLDLVDISAIEAYRLSVTQSAQSLAPIMATLHEMFASRAAGRGLVLCIDPALDVPDVRIDATRVVQALSNLLVNAIKFTPAGGRIDLRVETDAKEAVVSVRDTGAGVGPDDLPHIFERFWRARSTRGTRGLGLGLAIVNGIVAAHGGRVWMKSTLGRGSTVFLTLPLATATAPLTPAANREYALTP